MYTVNTGLCQGGRHVTALGVMVACIVTQVVNDKYVNVLAMNVSEEEIILYPRTKLGTFTSLDKKQQRSSSFWAVCHPLQTKLIL